MIGPGGLADPDGGIGHELLQEVGADAQGARAAGGMGGPHAPGGAGFVALTEDHVLHELAVGGVAANGHVGLGLGSFQYFGLSGLDALEDGGGAGGVLEYADAQVHLGGVRVLLERDGQTQNGVGRSRCDGLKHGDHLLVLQLTGCVLPTPGRDSQSECGMLPKVGAQVQRYAIAAPARGLSAEADRRRRKRPGHLGITCRGDGRLCDPWYGRRWTGDATYSDLYRFSDGVWLWYLAGSARPRLMVNLSTGQWESH